ncbi:MAG: hypothetical protein ACTHOB_10560 [Ginsengibacter sp.]
MKKAFLLIFLCQSAFAFSQTNNPPAVMSPKMFGYFQGVRLDSVDAEYGQLRILGESFTFDVEESSTRKTRTITDRNGSPLVFPNNNLPFALNFFYFNGWELAPSQLSDILILKKRSLPIVYKQ